MPSISLPAAVIGAGALGAGTSVLGGVLGASAAEKAATTQSNSYLQGLGIAQQEVGPYVAEGQSAGNSLSALYGLGPGGSGSIGPAFNAFSQSPSFQFPYQQGLRGVNFGLGSQGLLQSGSQAKATQQFGQGLASTYLMGSYVNPLLSIYGQGAQSASSLAGTSASLLGNAGSASAAGTVGAANAITGGLTGAAGSINGSIGNLALYSLLARGGGGSSSYQPISGGTPQSYNPVQYTQGSSLWGQ